MLTVNRPKFLAYSKIIELHIAGKLKLHWLQICKYQNGAPDSSRENRVRTVPLAMLYLLLLMPSSGVKPFAVVKLHILVNFGPGFLKNYLGLHFDTYKFVIRAI